MKSTEQPKRDSFWKKVRPVYKIIVFGFLLIFLLDAVNSIVSQNYSRFSDVLITFLIRSVIIIIIAFALASTYVFMIETVKRSPSFRQRQAIRHRGEVQNFRTYRLITDSRGQQFKQCLTCNAEGKLQRNKCRKCGSWIKE